MNLHLPLKKYIRTYPSDSKSSLRLCSTKQKSNIATSQNHNSKKNENTGPKKIKREGRGVQS